MHPRRPATAPPSSPGLFPPAKPDLCPVKQQPAAPGTRPSPGHPPLRSLYGSDSSRDPECHRAVSVPSRWAISLSGPSRPILGVGGAELPSLQGRVIPPVCRGPLLCALSPGDRRLGRSLLRWRINMQPARRVSCPEPGPCRDGPLASAARPGSARAGLDPRWPGGWESIPCCLLQGCDGLFTVPS